MSTEHLTYEQALRKAAALLKLAERTSSPAEAAEAAAKAKSIMDRYEIEQSVALDAQDEREQARPMESVEVFNGEQAFDADLKARLPRWRWELASTVVSAHRCEAYITTEHRFKTDSIGRLIYAPERTRINVVGRRSDVEAARYIYGYLLRQCEALVEQHGEGKGKTWRNNFRLGLVEAVERIFAKQRRALHREMTTEAETGADPDRALKRLHTAIEKQQAAQKDAHDYAKDVIGVRYSSARGDGGAFDYSARLAGREAGEQSITIGKGKAGLGTGKGRIGSGT